MYSRLSFLIGSLTAHIVVLFAASLIAIQTPTLKKTFVVFGAHTSKPTSVRYKSTNNIVPFVPQQQQVASKANPKSTNNNPTKNPNSHSASQTKPCARPKPVEGNERKTKGVPKQEPKQEPKKQTQRQAPRPKNVSPVKKLAEEKHSPLQIANKKTIPDKKTNQTAPTSRPKEQALKQSPPVTPTAQAQIKEQSLSENNENESTRSQAFDPDKASELDFTLLPDEHSQEILVYKKEIQREVDRVWRPPVGVSKGTVCSIQFTVSHSGSVECSYAQRSPVLIYDLSALRAAQNMIFSKAFWGKQFKIAFHQ